MAFSLRVSMVLVCSCLRFQLNKSGPLMSISQVCAIRQVHLQTPGNWPIQGYTSFAHWYSQKIYQTEIHPETTKKIDKMITHDNNLRTDDVVMVYSYLISTVLIK